MKRPLSNPSQLTDASAPIWVAAVALVNSECQVLMQRRPDESAHGGLWEFPGGKLEPGESPQNASVRELEEELGVVIAPDDLAPVSFAAGLTAGYVPQRPLIILLHASRVWEGTPEPRVASELCWCDWRSLGALEMPPLDYPLAEALCRLLRDRAV